MAILSNSASKFALRVVDYYLERWQPRNQEEFSFPFEFVASYFTEGVSAETLDAAVEELCKTYDPRKAFGNLGKEFVEEECGEAYLALSLAAAAEGMQCIDRFRVIDVRRSSKKRKLPVPPDIALGPAT